VLLQYAENRAQQLPLSSGAIDSDLPVICPRFKIDGRIVRTISTVLRFDTVLEVTASELRVELMFPADEQSDAFFRSRPRG
jgi:hypothetical protein